MTAFLRIIPFLCALLVFSFPAYAADETPAPPPVTQAGPVLAIRAGVHPDFDRLVVDWPRHIAYNVRRDGSHVTVTFAAAGQANWQDVIVARVTRMNGFLSSADKDG